MNLIIVPEWHQRGFAFAIRDSWFNRNATIIGLHFLSGQHRLLRDIIQKHSIKHCNIVFFDSIYHPLYTRVSELCSMFDTVNITRVTTETIPEHLRQSIGTIPHIHNEVDLSEAIESLACYPRDPTIWEQTVKARKRKLPNTQPKIFPILTRSGMTKDFTYLKKVSPYPFHIFKHHWDPELVSFICSQGIVGIAAPSASDHNQLRSFWNTYGIYVIEDSQNDFKVPETARTISFLNLLQDKTTLRIATIKNINYKHDLDTMQKHWMQAIESCVPPDLISVEHIDSLTKIHPKQLMCIRNVCIPNVKLIREKGSKIARMPLPQISEDKLPCVSICTLTRNHRLVFPFVVHSLRHQSYPLHKIEWIILQNGEQEIEDLIPKPLIRKLKRFHIETLPNDHGLSLGELRNRIVAQTNEDFVAFMDDDDLYFHTSLLARIKSLIKYNAQCVGCTEIGNYDLLQKKGSVASDGDHVFAEATMAFRKNFWRQRGFDAKETTGEAHGFLLGRHDNCIAIPYHFTILAMTHSENTTGTMRMLEGKEMIPLKELLTEEEQALVDSTSSYLRQRYKVVKTPGKRH